MCANLPFFISNVTLKTFAAAVVLYSSGSDINVNILFNKASIPKSNLALPKIAACNAPLFMYPFPFSKICAKSQVSPSRYCVRKVSSHSAKFSSDVSIILESIYVEQFVNGTNLGLSGLEISG